MSRDPSDKPAAPQAIRHAYEQHSVRGYYEQHGGEYRNPHEAAVRALLRRALPAWHTDLRHVLDLACGSGEVTLALRELGCCAVDGVDPYTGRAYQERTGQLAEPHSFEQIAAGALLGRSYSMVICSFALHLLAESWLPALVAQLGLLTSTLVVVTPHKRPHIREEWGWRLADELLADRVRARLYWRV